MTITPIDATCPTISNTTKTYNGTASTINVSGGANGTINYSTDNVTFSTTAPTRTNAGTTTVYVRMDASGNYQTKTCGSAQIIIEPAEATFTCSNKYYNGTSQAGCTCTNCTMSGTSSSTDAGGPWTVTATPDTNYTLSTTSLSWTMNKGTARITAIGDYDTFFTCHGISYSGGVQTYVPFNYNACVDTSHVDFSGNASTAYTSIYTDSQGLLMMYIMFDQYINGIVTYYPKNNANCNYSRNTYYHMQFMTPSVACRTKSYYKTANHTDIIYYYDRCKADLPNNYIYDIQRSGDIWICHYS